MKSRVPTYSGIELELGKEYMVGWGNKLKRCKLIKTSPKGFNFLNLENSKCIMKQCIYPKNSFSKPGEKEIRLANNKKVFTFTVWTPDIRIEWDK